jgi:hypothetical protein
MGHCYDFDNILAEKMAILTKIVIWAEKNDRDIVF